MMGHLHRQPKNQTSAEVVGWVEADVGSWMLGTDEAKTT